MARERHYVRSTIPDREAFVKITRHLIKNRGIAEGDEDSMIFIVAVSVADVAVG